MGTVVERARPDTATKLTHIATGSYTGDAGDKYVGLDRFGRISDQRWVEGTSAPYTGGTGTYTGDIDRYQYVYDRDGNPLGKLNTLAVALSEKYTYDSLNRLASFKRGTVSFSGSTVTLTGATESQDWGLDALGNWDTFTSSNTSTGSTTQTRGHDRQNALTSVGSDDLEYDNNGNLILDGTTGQSYTYDGWNRMGLADTGSVEKVYQYDALGRRVIAGDTATYYSKDWQALEEREIDNAGTTNAAVGGTAVAQNVWSTVYVDALVARDEDADIDPDTDGQGAGYDGSTVEGLERRLYFTQDANFNVTGLILDDTGDPTDDVVERYTYAPYGVRAVRNASWVAGSTAYDNLYAHQGGKMDAATGLVYFRFREYNPALGRWQTQDPIGWADGTNLFESYLGNPASFLDPLGLQVHGDKSPEEYDKHILKNEEAKKELERLKEERRKAVGKTRQQDLDKKLQEIEKSIKGHDKEIRQKWPNGRPGGNGCGGTGGKPCLCGCGKNGCSCAGGQITQFSISLAIDLASAWIQLFGPKPPPPPPPPPATQPSTQPSPGSGNGENGESGGGGFGGDRRPFGPFSPFGPPRLR